MTQMTPELPQPTSIEDDQPLLMIDPTSPANVSNTAASLARQPAPVAPDLGQQVGTGTGGVAPMGGRRGTSGNVIVDEAMKYLGTPYKWGGNGAGGVDCSGLTRLAYAAAGISLPRVSYMQANAGQRIPLAQAQAGDLIAWDNSSRNNGADHIAIYMGNGQIIEAPSAGKQVRIRSLGAKENAWAVRI